MLCYVIICKINRVDIFCRLSTIHERDRQTNKQADHGTVTSIGIGAIACQRCRLKQQWFNRLWLFSEYFELSDIYLFSCARLEMGRVIRRVFKAMIEQRSNDVCEEIGALQKKSGYKDPPLGRSGGRSLEIINRFCSIFSPNFVAAVWTVSVEIAWREKVKKIWIHTAVRLS